MVVKPNAQMFIAATWIFWRIVRHPADITFKITDGAVSIRPFAGISTFPYQIFITKANTG